MKLYHLSFDIEDLDESDLKKTFYPRVPKTTLPNENHSIPRICLSKSVLGCFNAMPEHFMYFEEGPYGHDHAIAVLYSVDLNDISPENFVDSNEIYECGLVPDAIINQECWCLEPISMTGEIVEIECLSDNRNDYLLCAREANRNFIYSVIDSVYDNYASVNADLLDEYSLFYIMNCYFYRISYALGCDLSHEFDRLSRSPDAVGMIDAVDVYTALMIDDEIVTLNFNGMKYKYPIYGHKLSLVEQIQAASSRAAEARSFENSPAMEATLVL